MMEPWIDNQWSRLECAMVYVPSNPDIQAGKDIGTDGALWSEVPDPDQLKREMHLLVDELEDAGVEVHVLYGHLTPPYPNQVFLRDLGQFVEDQFLVGNPSKEIRQGEQTVLKKTIVRGFDSQFFEARGNFECADLCLVGRKRAVLNVGKRTGKVGYQSVSGFLSGLDYQVDKTSENMGRSVPQHLLGTYHIIGPNQAVYRSKLHEFTYGFGNTLGLAESREVREKYAMNFVTLGPQEILMPDDCPNTRDFYRSFGINCRQSPMHELRKMNGGFACAVLPIRREPTGETWEG